MTFVDETKIERTARFGILPGGSRADTQEGIIEKMIAGAVELVELLEAEVNRIKAGGAFTKIGLKQRRVELARTALDRLATWETDLVAKRGVVVKLREDLKVQAVSADATAHQVLLGEIRTAIRAVPDLERISILHSAVEQGDAVVFQAISDWPASLGSLVPIEMLEAARERWAERLDPALAVKVRSLAERVDQYAATLRTARSTIEKIGGIEPDALEMLDAKGDAA